MRMWGIPRISIPGDGNGVGLPIAIRVCTDHMLWWVVWIVQQYVYLRYCHPSERRSVSVSEEEQTCW